jgi:hypothetical protein
MSESKTIDVPDWFHDHVEAHRRDDETMADALIRLSGGPSPESVAGFLSEETASEMRSALDEKSDAVTDGRASLVERIDDS